MKKRNSKKKAMSMFLTAAMIMTTFSPAVYGAEFTDGGNVREEFAWEDAAVESAGVFQDGSAADAETEEVCDAFSDERMTFRDVGGVDSEVIYNITDGPVTLTGGGTYAIIGNGELTGNTITVNGGEYTIRLRDVNIVKAGYDECAFNITGGAIVNLILESENVLESGWDCAGLQLANESSLIISSESRGTMQATGGHNGAGIGSGNGGSVGAITVKGGSVIATGGDNGAGIGGGYYSSVENITIEGGSVTATGGEGGAGIGSGYCYSSVGTITVKTGSVTAIGGENGAGIGSGYLFCSVEDIIIEGGSVTATGGEDGAGIGSGFYQSSAVAITVKGGNVTATGGEGGAGIGSGFSSSAGVITVKGGSVTAEGGEDGAGIGSGFSSSAGNITVEGGSVTATGGTNGAGIGAGRSASGSSSFSTGDNGHAFIIASSISDTSSSGAWSGVVFQENAGNVYNTPALTEDAEIPEGKTLVIENDKTLTLGDGVTLTNRGTIQINDGGKLDISQGVLNNFGTINSPLTPEENVNNKTSELTFSIEKNDEKITEATLDDDIMLIVEIKGVDDTVSNLLRAMPRLTPKHKVIFYCDGEEIYSEDVSDTEEVLKVQQEIFLSKDKFRAGTHTFTAEYTGSNTQWLPCSNTIENFEIKKKSLNESDFIFEAPQDLLYNGSGKEANVYPSETISGIGTITITYWDSLDTQLSGIPSMPGTYKVKADVKAGSVYDAAQLGSDNWSFQIEYLQAPANSYTIEGTCFVSGDSEAETLWVKESAAILPAEDYKISENLDGDYTGCLQITESIEAGSKNIYLQDEDGHRTEAITISEKIQIDETAPSLNIQIGSDTFAELKQEIPFSHFYKTEKTGVLKTDDGDGSGIKADSLKYYISDKSLLNTEAADSYEAALETAVGGNWQSYTAESEITLPKESKSIIYAKVTDNVGNTAYAGSDGYVIYEDTELAATEAAYTRNSNEDVTAGITLHGNTIASIKNGNTALTPGDDYTVTENAIVLKAAYLDTLSPGNVTFNISSNPMGEIYTEAEGNEAPAEQELLVKIRNPYIPPVITPSPTPNPTPSPTPTPTPEPIPDNFPEGSKKNPDGSITTPDGTVVDKDGTITLPGGVVLKPDADGKTPTIDKDNTVTDTNGTVIKKDGTIILPGADADSKEDDTVIEKGNGSHPVYDPEKGTVTVSEGNKVTLPSGKELTPPKDSIVEADGTVTAPDGTIYKPDGTIYKLDGTVVDADGIVHNPDGSIQNPDGSYLRPAKPMLKSAEVFSTGNRVRAVLSGESAGASGYDFVISRNINCIRDKDYLQVSKNVLETETDFRYIPKGTYYVYCHAWLRGNDGMKVFGPWSNYKRLTVKAVTPKLPEITDIRVKGSFVTVTYTKCTGASGYDVILGSGYKKVYGEYRPVNYGNLVKKVKKGDTLTVTFRNVPKGRYYVGLHAWNRTSEDGKKVFSPWSKSKKIIVK